MQKTITSLVLISTIIIAVAIPSFAKGYIDKRFYAKATITSINTVNVTKESGIKIDEVHVKLKVLDGKFKDQIKTAIYGTESDLPTDLKYKVGDTYFIGISKTYDVGTSAHISIYHADNSFNIIVIITLMVLSIIAIGKLKGIASLFALIATIGLIFLVLIPLTLKGYPPLPIAVGISIVSIMITLPIIAGFHLKTGAAILGAIAGVTFASLLALFFGEIMNLSGMITNEMLTVFYVSNVKIDLKSVLLSGMILAALGAIMDICISMASATAEIFHAKPDIDEKEAFQSVLNIGTDILGTMVNTLILAYVGSSLALILLITMRIQPDMSFWMVLNYNPVLSEIVKSVVGSIGMFISIPITALISVKLYKWRLGTQN